jgi:hypothetical protein
MKKQEISVRERNIIRTKTKTKAKRKMMIMKKERFTTKKKKAIYMNRIITVNKKRNNLITF